MKCEVVQPGFELITPLDRDKILKTLELCGRTCYKSEDKITSGSTSKFVRMICKRNHESVLEHISLTARIICSRAASHQLVRHRIASYSQESQRYCNYGKAEALQVICPPWIGIPLGTIVSSAPLNKRQSDWSTTIHQCYAEYLSELKQGAPPEDARYVLPNATKTEVTTTFNLRMWKHVFRERALNKAAQWEIRGIFQNIHSQFIKALPEVFEETNDQ